MVLSLGLYAYYKNGDKVSFYISLTGLLGFLIDALDYTVIGHNLELYAIYGVLFIFLIGLASHSLGLNLAWAIGSTLIIGILTYLGFTSNMSLGIITADQVYNSEYGYLNTVQSSNLSLVRELLVSIIMFLWLWKSSKLEFKNSHQTLGLILIGFGFLLLEGGSFIIHSLGGFAFRDLPEFILVGSSLLLTIYIVSYCMIILGLKWRV